MTLLNRFSFFAAAVASFALPFNLSAEAPSAPTSTESAPPAETAPAEPPPATVFESEHAEVQTLDDETRFLLTGNVRVTGNNLWVYCDRLEVYTARLGSPEAEAMEAGGILRIFAIGNVRIEQEGREARSGRAEVFPQDGLIVLTESPIIRDDQGTVTGERITFIQGETRAVVEGGDRGPARITLPAMPDLGAQTQPRSREERRRGN